MNKPKIRFKGFDGEWEKKMIGEVANTIGGGTPSTNNPMYWDGPIQWFTPSEIGQNKYIEKSQRTITIEGLEKSSAKLIPANSILLSSRATIGEMSINTCECATNQGFQSLVPYKADLEFLYSLMLTKKDDLIKLSHGSTFLEISANKVRSINIYVPQVAEQTQIAEYFKQLDSVIELTEKKVASLKQVKQASLQQMFPQEGETTPRIRFKGFEEEWKKVTIKDVCTHQHSTISQNKLGEFNGPYPIFGASGFIKNVPFFVQDKEYIGVVKDGAGVGRMNLYPAKSSILGTMHYLLANEGNNISFLYNLLQTLDLTIFATGSTIPHIYFKDYSDFNIYIPSLAEQTQIANYFSNLDKQIALHEARLEKLKSVKASCLDLMFV